MTNIIQNEQYYKFLISLLHTNHDEAQQELVNRCHIYGKKYEEANEDFNVILGEECRRLLKEIEEADSGFSVARKKAALSAWVRLFVPDIKEAQQTIASYAVEQTPVKFYKLGDLEELAKESTDTSLVKGLIPLGGLILLAASAKVGKSLFVTMLLHCVSLGLPFLDRNTVQGNVLYVQNEENLVNTTRKRIQTSGIKKLQLEDYDKYREMLWGNQITICHKLDIAQDQELILKKVQELDIKLVLIDALGSSFERSGFDELSPEVPGHLYRLQRLAQQNNFTVVLIHHANKLGDNNTQDGRMKSIAGRSGITRANDCNAVLSRVENARTKETFVQLNTIPRDGDPVMIQYKIAKQEAAMWGFEVIQDSILTAENLELQNKILRLLYDRWEDWNQQPTKPELPYGYTLREIMALVHASEEETIARLNDMLNSEGIIHYADQTIGRWVYAIHESGESWLDTYLEKEEESKSINETKALEEDLSAAVLESLRAAIIAGSEERCNSLLAPLQKDGGEKYRKLVAKLTKEEKNNLWLVYKPPTYPRGTKVTIINEDISSVVSRVEYISEGRYHKYYLDNTENTYRQEQLKYAANSEIDHERNL